MLSFKSNLSQKSKLEKLKTTDANLITVTFHFIFITTNFLVENFFKLRDTSICVIFIFYISVFSLPNFKTVPYSPV